MGMYKWRCRGLTGEVTVALPGTKWGGKGDFAGLTGKVTITLPENDWGGKGNIAGD